MDVENLNAGQRFEELPTTYIIFITENDIWGAGKALYPMDRFNIVTAELFEDRQHILYVNASFKGDELLLLMSISGRRASIKPLIKARFGNDVHPLAYYSNRSSIVITFVKTPLYSLCFNPNVVIKVLYIDIFGDTNSLIRSGLLRRTL